MEDKDNLYILDEEENDLDENPLNYAVYTDEERAAEQQEEEKSGKHINSFGLMLKIMFSPVEGWKALRRSGKTIEALQGSLFYPLLAILAACKFTDYFYSVDVSLQTVLTGAVVEFVSFFFGYFCVQMVLSMFLSKELKDKFESKFGVSYILVSMSTLVLFSIFTEILPMLWPILIFLPIWTLYIMFKGVRFFKFPQQKEMRFYILAGAAVVGMPVLIRWILSNLLPY